MEYRGYFIYGGAMRVWNATRKLGLIEQHGPNISTHPRTKTSRTTEDDDGGPSAAEF